MLCALHFDAHAARAAGDGPHCRIEIARRKIGHLHLGDFFRLGARELAYLVGMRRLAAFFELQRFLDQHRRRRRLDDERETLVLKRGNHDRQRQAGFHFLGLRVERLAELHDVETALAQRRPDGWTRVGFAGGHLQLDKTDDFLSHDDCSFWWVVTGRDSTLPSPLKTPALITITLSRLVRNPVLPAW